MSNLPDSAPCPTASPPSSDSPNSRVVLSILSVKPNSDLEGDDDFVPFYDNKADIYGFVTIDGEEFKLPEITENNYPHWDRDGVFRKEVSSTLVPIKIAIWEADELATGDDDHVDICPLPDKADLDLVFNLCSLELSGDIATQSTQGVITVSGGSDDNDATIRFKVELEDSRPVTDNDLALVEVDLVQVRHHTQRLVAGKPTAVMARIANNFDVNITTNLRVQISGGGVNVDDTFPVTLGAGEVKKVYLYENSPVIFPASSTPYEIAVIASIEDPSSNSLPIDDCRRMNDSIRNRIVWKVISTKPELSFLWMKVGTLLDIGNYTPNSHFSEIMELGQAYIEAVFPIVDPFADESPFPLSPPLNASVNFLSSILQAFQIPLDALEPFALVFELNGAAILAGYDHLMGVLPSHDWFERFSLKLKRWKEVTGLSLGEFAPHAVIFLPRRKSEDGNDIGPQMTLPGHELGHCYGLSTDSRLKKSWLCDVDWPVVGALPCGAAGGFDEYEHEDETLQAGNPASGYWVSQGGEPPAILPLVNQEQCDSHCLMGGSPRNAHLSWGTDGRWIDAADYEHLLTKLSLVPDPEVIYVSGMISWHDQMYMGPIYLLPQGTPDREELFGLYAVRFEDKDGQPLAEYGIPINWNAPHFPRPMPISFFGLTLPYDRRTQRIVFLNRGTGKILGQRTVSRRAPSVRIESPYQETRVDDGTPLDVRWLAKDEDDDELTYTILVSPTGERWWPAASWLTEERYELPTDPLEPGHYLLKVLAHDGVHVSESEPVRFRLDRAY